MRLPSAPPTRSPLATITAALGGLVLAMTLTACGEDDVDPDQVDAVEAPSEGACRELEPSDLESAHNANRTVDCEEPHTAETFAVLELPEELHDRELTDAAVSTEAMGSCGRRLIDHLNADESLVLRSVLGWAAFRPSEKAWADGARWVRCDVVGGSAQSKELVRLPDSTKGLLGRQAQDRWMVCARGEDVADGDTVPCDQPHEWRAVTTIKVGEPEDEYPGDAAVAKKTKDYCTESVAAWLKYPDEHEVGFTWFGEAQWGAGNRRSICWARTAT